TNESSSSENIIRQAKNIDQKHGNNKFKEKFSDTHNITYTEKELDFMKKKAAIFLLNLFMNVNDNLGNAAVDTSNRSGKYKRPQYKLPSLDTVID
ncbi:5638_t:CDS:1, partial [Entrophospora sp. SA101]